jgi:hypothetical protein
MTLRNYSNTAVQTALAVSINASTTTVQVSATTGFPAAPFVLAIDADTANQELVLVTAIAGTNLTVTRGYDNTTGVSHDVGAVVRHSHAAIDFKDSRDHEAATAAHGATGAVVGTTNTQTLTNKDLSSGTNIFPGNLATDAEVASVAATAAADLATHAADTSTHGVGEVVGRTEAQVLTTKTIALGSNTVSGTTAQFNAANTDGDFATLAGTETLTNKNLASATNTLPGDLERFIGYDSAVLNTGAVLSLTGYLTYNITEVVGAVYRVTAYLECSNAAGEFTTLTIYEDDGLGGDVTKVAECIRDHRVSSRREGVSCIGLYAGADAGSRRFRLAIAGSGPGSTIHGDQTPSILMVERVA